MCGINGFTWQDKNLIQLMNQKIKHRGPDDDGFFINENISLGHTRLSIIDLSSKGSQPMCYKDLVIAFNGEIYNFQEIKKELKDLGYKFNSKTDTEVVLLSYNEWGEACLQKFNGMFSFAIWNKQSKKLLIARDRLGIKPLYYYYKDNKLIFSSEIKSILEYKGIDKTIVPERINFIYQMSCLPGDLTMFKFIKQLPAARYLTFEKDSLNINKYWDIIDFKDIKSKNKIKQQIKTILGDSVRKRMISDVPLGVFLSGGIDSSIIAYLAQNNSKEKIKTFSIGFETDIEAEKYNADFKLAKKTAKFFNTEHHEIILKKGQAREYFNYLADNLELPNTMSTAIPSFWISKYAKEKVSVILGGDGGDELFGGYERYKLSLYISKFSKLPSYLKKIIPLNFIGQMLNKEDLAKKLNPSSRLEHYMSLKCHQPGDLSKVLKNSLYEPEIVKDYLSEKYFKNPPTDDFEKYFMWVDAQTWLLDHSLIRTDKTTMAHGLEERVPILDHRLVELAYKIPTKYKVNFKNTKIIFKSVFKNNLPNFLFKQPKRGWLSPAAKWLRNELKDIAYEVLSDDYIPESNQYFDLPAARKILDEHISGKKYNLHLIWLLITWQLWYKKYIK